MTLVENSNEGKKTLAMNKYTQSRRANTKHRPPIDARNALQFSQRLKYELLSAIDYKKANSEDKVPEIKIEMPSNRLCWYGSNGEKNQYIK